MKYPVIFFLLFISFSTVFAQKQTKIEDDKSIVLSGKLIDTTNGQPVSFASLAAMKTVNGTNITLGSATSNEEGQFIIQNLPKGNATLIISYIGYKKKEQKLLLSVNLDLGIIQMQQDGLQLEEVSVKGEKAAMEMSLEKRVFNVEKNISSVGGTAENLLRNVPSITIASDGTAQFRNKTTTIYINGKPTQLNLAQIPANQIETVEIISNPSAKYDASASSGIINLVLKKNRKPGYNGSGSVGVGNNYRFDGMLNADVNIGKWALSVLYNVNATQNPLSGYANRTSFNASGSPQSYFSQNTNVALTNLFQNGRVAGESGEVDHIKPGKADQLYRSKVTR